MPVVDRQVVPILQKYAAVVHDYHEDEEAGEEEEEELRYQLDLQAFSTIICNSDAFEKELKSREQARKERCRYHPACHERGPGDEQRVGQGGDELQAGQPSRRKRSRNDQSQS